MAERQRRELGGAVMAYTIKRALMPEGVRYSLYSGSIDLIGDFTSLDTAKYVAELLDWAHARGDDFLMENWQEDKVGTWSVIY